ncbi:unnamed protein product [Ectocarpus sp. 8 AP-2014]
MKATLLCSIQGPTCWTSQSSLARCCRRVSTLDANTIAKEETDTTLVMFAAFSKMISLIYQLRFDLKLVMLGGTHLLYVCAQTKNKHSSPAQTNGFWTRGLPLLPPNKTRLIEYQIHGWISKIAATKLNPQLASTSANCDHPASITLEMKGILRTHQFQ